MRCPLFHEYHTVPPRAAHVLTTLNSSCFGNCIQPCRTICGYGAQASPYLQRWTALPKTPFEISPLMSLISTTTAVGRVCRRTGVVEDGEPCKNIARILHSAEPLKKLFFWPTTSEHVGAAIQQTRQVICAICAVGYCFKETQSVGTHRGCGERAAKVCVLCWVHRAFLNFVV